MGAGLCPRSSPPDGEAFHLVLAASGPAEARESRRARGSSQNAASFFQLSTGDANSVIGREWWWLGGEQKLPVTTAQWSAYEPMVQHHLSASLDAMRIDGRSEGLVLDLAPFTHPPAPYQVWKGRPFEVMNKNEPALLGKLAIAGYTKDLWDLHPSQLPPAASHGRVVTGFYQVRTEHTDQLVELTRYLQDPSSPSCSRQEPPRRRVVVLIELERPAFLFGNVDRFSKRRSAQSPGMIQVPQGENDSVPPGEAVFQWWWGDPTEGGLGHWKNYHPHVSARLEQALVDHERFRSCLQQVPIDEVRYSLQRISRERPFDYVEQSSLSGFREPFLPSHVLTVGSSHYDDQARTTNNCFVQFHTGNPRRRRPVRRIRRGEAAGLAMPDGEPCGVCFSNAGVLTGCEKGHIICPACLRMGLRSITGDITQITNLLCGCLGASDELALAGLAKQADAGMQECQARPPKDELERKEFDMELVQLRRAFQLAAEAIPDGAFQAKVADWLDLVKKRAMEHLYHACRSPGCAMSNWILREDFERHYRRAGKCSWTCQRGHRNSVLPAQEDIDEMNRNLLLHPEHYTDMCGSDKLALRRFRLCPACISAGLLTFAVHEAGCKQWPGSPGGHLHCFCFHCLRPWGSGVGECGHHNQCSDPGIQQVRRIPDSEGSERMEIGYIDADAYIKWVMGGRFCPPTVFENGEALGHTRQGQLGMGDTSVLKRTMKEGTN